MESFQRGTARMKRQELSGAGVFGDTYPFHPQMPFLHSLPSAQRRSHFHPHMHPQLHLHLHLAPLDNLVIRAHAL